MHRRDLLKSAGALALWNAFRPDVICGAQAMDASDLRDSREVLTLNKGWRFFAGDIPLTKSFVGGAEGAAAFESYDFSQTASGLGAAFVAYDDSAWATLDLPHDFVSFQRVEAGASPAQGYRRRGVGWYRRRIRLAPGDRGKHIELQFEGIATHATIWFNGVLVCRNWSGYTSAYIDVTPFATYGEALNTLVVRADAQVMEGWWYEGGGIYRDAWIIKRNPTHIVTDGVFAHPVKTEQGWILPVQVTLNNSSVADQAVIVTSELWDGEGLVSTQRVEAQVPTLSNAVAHMTLTHDSPRLWDVDDPHLYNVRTRVERNGTLLDEVTTQCGFRTQRFDPDQGFFLNDRQVKLQGVCVHQDHAGVGVAVPAGLIDYRLRRLKDMGCNAIRGAHNAQNKSLLDACDRIGILVMDENRNFNSSPDYLAQLQWMVRRDRNHPSIILWSLFNEEPLQGTEAGREIARRMREAVRELDSSRPLTGAMNKDHFKPINVSLELDVVGINYNHKLYDDFHRAHPDQPMMSSEDTSAYMTRGEYRTNNERHVFASYDDDASEWGATHRQAWKEIAQRDYLAGGFVWTGFDYHGEPTPHRWPTNSSSFGIMDLCGFEKTAFYIHQALWVQDRPILSLLPHWNWQGREGEPIKVMACSNLEEVELRLNGKSQGRQRVARFEMNHWMVPYAPGRLDLIGYKNGKIAARQHVETAGQVSALRLVVDRPRMQGDGWDAQPIKVEAVDAQGRFMPLAKNMVSFEIELGEIIGLGNGDPNSMESEKGNKRSLFNGLAQVIVRSIEGTEGALKVTAKADGLKSASVAVIVEAAKPPRSQA